MRTRSRTGGHRAVHGRSRRPGPRWWAAVVVALLAGVACGPGVAAAAPSDCRWRQTAQELARSLDGVTGDQAERVRSILADAGITATSTLPEQCRTAATPKATGPKTATPKTSPEPAAPKPAGPSPSTPSPGAAGSAGPTAAAALGWGTPNRSDDFTAAASAGDWGIYDGPGHGGEGRRTPDAVSIADGLLTLRGDSSGNTAGMAWGAGQKYGRWEARVRAPASDPSYHALLLLWPDAENFPVGGEIDFMEMMDESRQSTNLFLHYGSNNNQVDGDVRIDATQWHNWAVEWTPAGVTAFVDGKQWWHTADTSILPPGPMHLCIQLDWFPGGGGSVTPSQMQVDWVRQYPVAAAGGAG